LNSKRGSRSYDLLDAAREVDGYCRRQNWRYCIIGGMALLRWGEQRMTKDVAITLLTAFGDEELPARNGTSPGQSWDASGPPSSQAE
jgi:hypothetical protein